MIMMMMSTGDIDEECDMEGDRHLLSNHADIEATINNTIEHFLYEESFREEQKSCLHLVCPLLRTLVSDPKDLTVKRIPHL